MTPGPSRDRPPDSTAVLQPHSLPWRTLLVALLVCIAGCNAVAVDPTPPNQTTTLTPAPVPTGDVAGPSSPKETLPPGVSANGSVRTGLLARAHTATLGNTTYTWTLAVTEAQVGTPATVWQSTRRVAVGPNATFVKRTGSAPVEEVARYGADGMWYERRGGSDTTAAVARPSHGWVHSFARTAITQYLADLRFDVTAVNRTGQRFYRLTAFADGTRVVDTRRGRLRARNYRVTAFVAPSGFVQQFVVEYDRGVGTNRRHVYLWFGYAGLGATTVDRPAWVPPTPSDSGPSSVTPTTSDSVPSSDTSTVSDFGPAGELSSVGRPK